MKSKTSSSDAMQTRVPSGWFNAGLLCKNFSRFWPLWAVYAVIWLMMLPLAQAVVLFGSSAQDYDDPAWLALNSQETLLNLGTYGGLWMAMVFGLLFAVALFSYLCSARSVGMMHSFPIKREGLFFTNYLTGVAVFVGTAALALALTAGVQAAAGVLVWEYIGWSFLAITGQMLFFYSFAVFCAMFTGQLLAIPVFYGILNILAMGVSVLVQNFAALFFYGYPGGGTPDWVMWLTPAYQLGRDLNVDWEWSDSTGVYTNLNAEGLGTVGIYALVALVLTALALAVYRCRRSETAGDTVTVSWAQVIFRWGVGLCMALSLGQGLYFLVWEQFRESGGYSLPAILVCMIFMGLVGYYAAEMLLKKSFRVLRSGWKGGLALTVVLVALGVGVSMDVTGVERRVPAAAEVESLYFSISGENYCSGNISDPAVMEQFRAAHTQIVAEKDTQLARQRESWEMVDTEEDVMCYAYITFQYYLSNGSMVHRNYSIHYLESELQNPDSAIALLADLVTLPAIQRANLFGGAEVVRVTGGEYNYPQFTDAQQGGSEWDWNHDSLTAEQAQVLFAALERDIDAGHFAKNQFSSTLWWQETYANTLTLYYLDGRDESNAMEILFSTNCTYLVAAMDALDIASESKPLLSQAQLYQEESWEDDGYDSEFIYPETAGISAVGIIGGADGPTQIYVS